MDGVPAEPISSWRKELNMSERIFVYNWGEAPYNFEVDFKKLEGYEEAFQEIFGKSTYRGWDGYYQFDNIVFINDIIQNGIREYAKMYEKTHTSVATMWQIPSIVAILMCSSIVNRGDGAGYILHLASPCDRAKLEAVQPIVKLICEGQLPFTLIGGINDDSIRTDKYVPDPDWVEYMYQ